MRRPFISMFCVSLPALTGALTLKGEVRAESEFFAPNCSGCRFDDPATCAGGHFHGVHSDSSKSDINLSAATTPCIYAYKASWYGSQYDKAGAAFGNWVPDPTNPNHGKERVTTNSFDVIGGPPPVPDITVTDSVAPATDLSISFGGAAVGNSTTRTTTVRNDGAADLMLGPAAQPPRHSTSPPTTAPDRPSPPAAEGGCDRRKRRLVGKRREEFHDRRLT